jgi:hypothetical protein
VTVADLQAMGVKHFATATDGKVQWGVNRYDAWHRWRLMQRPVDERIQRTHFKNNWGEVSSSDVCYSLIRFVSEITKKDGSDYPGRTLYELVIMIQFKLEGKGLYWKLLDGDEFITLRNTVDFLMKQRAAQGLGVRHSSLPATLAIQSRLWDLGVLGSDSAEKLRDTLQFLIGYHFALRGGKEHRALRFPGSENPSQLSVFIDEEGSECLRYQEDKQTKTDQGGLSKKAHDPKVVYAYGPPDREKNVLYLFKKYISLCPKNDGDDCFWRQCSKALHPLPNLWYTKRAAGKNTLNKTVKKLMEKAKIPGKWTNHSLRSGCATTLHRHNVDEQVIKQITGHRSDAVRDYKRTDLSVLKHAESVLVSGKDAVHGNTSGVATPLKDSELLKGPQIFDSSSEDEREVGVDQVKRLPSSTKQVPTSVAEVGSLNAKRSKLALSKAKSPLDLKSSVKRKQKAVVVPKPKAFHEGVEVLEMTPEEYKQRKPKQAPRTDYNAGCQVPGRDFTEDFSCQSDPSVHCHTVDCQMKRFHCRNYHGKRCCNFMCGFGEFLNGGQCTEGPDLKKIHLTMSFRKRDGAKSKKSKREGGEEGESSSV